MDTPKKKHYKGVVVDNPGLCVCCSQNNNNVKNAYIINQAGQAGPAKLFAKKAYSVKFALVRAKRKLFKTPPIIDCIHINLCVFFTS